MRRLLLAGALAAMLVLGVAIGAWATIPSSDGFIHGCYANSTSRIKQFWLLDNDQDGGQCPSGYSEVKLVGTADP